MIACGIAEKLIKMAAIHLAVHLNNQRLVENCVQATISSQDMYIRFYFVFLNIYKCVRNQIHSHMIIASYIFKCAMLYSGNFWQ